MYHLLMVTCSLDALKKSSKKKEMRIKRKKSRCYNKLYTVERRQDQDDEMLGFGFVFVG